MYLTESSYRPAFKSISNALKVVGNVSVIAVSGTISPHFLQPINLLLERRLNTYQLCGSKFANKFMQYICFPQLNETELQLATIQVLGRFLEFERNTSNLRIIIFSKTINFLTTLFHKKRFS